MEADRSLAALPASARASQRACPEHCRRQHDGPQSRGLSTGGRVGAAHGICHSRLVVVHCRDGGRRTSSLFSATDRRLSSARRQYRWIQRHLGSSSQPTRSAFGGAVCRMDGRESCRPRRLPRLALRRGSKADRRFSAVAIEVGPDAPDRSSTDWVFIAKLRSAKPASIWPAC